jgi:hypothetical protein
MQKNGAVEACYFDTSVTRIYSPCNQQCNPQTNRICGLVLDKDRKVPGWIPGATRFSEN